MINREQRYAQACAMAAQDQGLAPLNAAAKARGLDLANAGVRYFCEQTGGFTMVGCFYYADRVLTVTNEGAWLACEQPREAWLGDYTGEESRVVTDGLIESAAGIVQLAIELAESAR